MQGRRKPSDYIGCICKVKTPYYNIKEGRIKFKARPMLVIGAEKENFPCDFSGLPVSRVTNRVNINDMYDFELNRELCALLSLHSAPSYIRTHKHTTFHSADMHWEPISNIKDNLEVEYSKIQKVHRNFIDSLF